MGDVVRSVAVLGALILALYLVGRLFFTVTPDEPTRTLDHAAAIEASREAVDFALVAPTDLPDGWRATSVRVDDDTWHLGVVTDDDEYVGLEQVREGVRATVRRFAEGSEAAGDVTVDGERWALRTGPRDDLTFVRPEGDTTVLVTGSASRAQLERYLSSLSASS